MRVSGFCVQPGALFAMQCGCYDASWSENLNERDISNSSDKKDQAPFGARLTMA